MNKNTTIALALALAAGASQAQNVTIYGVLDAAVEHLTNVNAGGDSNRMPGLTGGLAPSRLGFRATEDLGDGLKAVLTIEQGFGVDAGTLNQGGRAWGRQAFVGLQGPWGGLTLGATYSFGRDAVNAGPSPSGTNCPGESSSDSQACRQWSALVKYDAAQWGVGFAVDQIRGGTGAFAGLTSSDLTDRRATLTGWVKFDALKLGAGVIDRRNEASAATPKSKLWYLGASYPVTPAFTLDGELFKLDYAGSANEAQLVARRGVYSLSKRTAIYATAGRIDNEGTLALSVTNAAPGAGPAAGEGQTGLAMGIRHSF